MQIAILTSGSRGDVQPFIALGVGLKRAGYQVKLVTHDPFASMIREQGLDFAAIEGNPQEWIQGESGQAMMQTRSPLGFVRRLREVLDPALAKIQLDSWQACQGVDAIVAGGIALWGVDIAERLQVPCFLTTLQPVSSTRAFPSSLFPPASARLGGLYNRLTYTIANNVLLRLFSPALNTFRQSVLQLPFSHKSLWQRIRDRQLPVLNAVSPTVIPRPTDWTALDYMSGYLFLDQATDFVPPADLIDFLADGSPPVYVGFGSMSGEASGRTLEIALAALKSTQQRGLLVTGWSGIQQLDLPDSIFKVNSIPHDWLFPQMACIVHHGGAGTTAATFRAGIPGVIVPFLGDQPFWGDRAFKLGVSPAPIDHKTINAEQLVAAISQATTNPSIRDRAQALGEKIRSEDGVAQAVEIISQTIKRRV
jgi:sterol 3beta-glucosyltransferase